MESHFQLIDYIKNLLFNSTNENQENQARRLLELAKEQEKYLEIIPKCKDKQWKTCRVEKMRL